MSTEIKEERVTKVVAELKEIVNLISGMNVEDMDENKKLISYGLDSILLLTLAKQLAAKYGLEIPLDVFFTTLNTLQIIAEYIAENTEDVVEEVEEITEDIEEVLAEEDFEDNDFMDEMDDLDISSFGDLEIPEGVSGDANVAILLSMFQNQYDIIKSQNDILSQMIAPKAKAGKKVANAKETAQKSTKQTSKKSENYYRPYHKQEFNSEDDVPPLQLKYIKNIEERLNSLTAISKEKTQYYRKVYASNRNSAGFRPLYKEMLYQIIAERAKGSKLVDIDGNEMIDLTMGFGVLLFGHSPEFVKNALKEELENGMPVGPMGRLTGEVARSICELTGMERVFFCNSGTEADMFAVRVARAVTKKNKVVCFKGAFHGTYDGFLGIPTYIDDPDNATISMVPGVTDNAVKDFILLDYDSEASLRYIEEHSDIIAAVITEPVQSRRPDLQPGEFLKKLRKVTEDNGVALIFDEIITGFRIASGGAQEYFGVRADIATYGKVIGGGMPIGILAGKSEFLDSIDGGMWNFGDNSVPPCEEKRTFVAGTFCHHPMAMAACHSVLNYIKENKDNIYDALNQKTTDFVNELNQFFDEEKVDIHINHFGSLFRFTVNLEKEIFYYGLLEKGIYIWEGRNCFLSTAHSKEDVDYIINAVKTTIHEMKEAGFFAE